MARFIGIDFEFANGDPGSICRYGIAFADGTTEHGFVQLHESCPEQQRTKYHMVTQEQTDSGITFDQLHARIAELNNEEETIFVAHALKSDRRAWLAAQTLFGLDVLPLCWTDSLIIARAEYGIGKNQPGAGIAAIAERYGMAIEHHHPADDALVCLEIVKRSKQKIQYIEDVPTRRRRRTIQL